MEKTLINMNHRGFKIYRRDDRKYSAIHIENGKCLCSTRIEMMGKRQVKRMIDAYNEEPLDDNDIESELMPAGSYDDTTWYEGD